MHPTADTLPLIFGYLLGRRVMPGVRLLQFLNPCRRLASVDGARLFLNQALAFHLRAALRVTLHGASREARGSDYRGWRQVRGVSVTHPNKPMHPTPVGRASHAR